MQMPPEADTSKITRAVEILLAAGMALTVLSSPFLALTRLYSLPFGSCVRLPNGIKIGYEAYMDFKRPYLKPVAVVRTPEGKAIGQEIWPIRITEKAAFGSTTIGYDSSRGNFTFIWTTETGAVKANENPELYRHLSEDLGETYYGGTKKYMSIPYGFIIGSWKKDIGVMSAIHLSGHGKLRIVAFNID